LCLAKRSIDQDQFSIKHFAGDVQYCVAGFLEKNRDTLSADLIKGIKTSSHSILRDCFKTEGKHPSPSLQAAFF
jgi:myosin heavy subunit